MSLNDDILVEAPSDKRGRGRPRKYPIGQSPSERLKAARENGMQRGRGRPRKVPTENSIPVVPVQMPLPNMGGATMSDEDDDLDDLDDEGLLVTAPSSGEDELVSVPVKRGRGRPPKKAKNGQTEPFHLLQTQPPPVIASARSRGRPPSSATNNGHPIPSTGPNGVSRRGRPRKNV